LIVMLVPLIVRSRYSLGVGLAPIESLVERAVAFGLPALALTDIDNFHGQPRFHDLCQRARVRAVTAAEITMPQGMARLFVVARDAHGYRNLCSVLSALHGGQGATAQRRAAIDPFETVVAHAGGVCVLTDDAETLRHLAVDGGLAASQLRALVIRPADHDARTLLAAAAERRIDVVAAAEADVLDPDDAAAQLLLAALRDGRRIREEELADAAPSAHWLRPPAEAEVLFADLPAAVAGANAVAASCDFELRRRTAGAPSRAASGMDAARELEERCRSALAAARAAGDCSGEAYDARLLTELEAIAALGYARYFLDAAAVNDGAAELGIATFPRGSAASSLTVHLLGISPFDPLTHGLHFERFLHFARAKPPDVDLDVCFERRDELLHWTYGRFGRERVAVVGALHTYGPRSLLRGAARVLGIASEPATAPGAPPPERGTRFAETTARVLAKLVGLPRLLALHPGGVVIAPGRVDELVPVERAARGLTVTQYDADGIEAIGLPKLDLLGNRFLTQETRAWTLVGRANGARAAANAIAPDDAATLALIHAADTVGCYQLETPALRALLLQLGARSFDDCVAALALVRPGASAGMAKREYLSARRSGRGTVPPLYDEDVMTLLSTAGGISLGAADRLRTAIIAAAPEQHDALGREFVTLASKRGLDPARAAAAWSVATRFAAYSFCKAHALSYARLAFRSAFLKAHHPAAFACALLDSYGGAYPLRTVAADFGRAGVSILAPSVNSSGRASSLEIGARVRLGFARVKHLTSRGAAALIAERSAHGPFVSVQDLAARVALTRPELRALLLCGACDELAPTAADCASLGVADPEQCAAARREAADSRRPREGAAAPRADRALVRIRDELAILGVHVTDHPLRVLRGEARRQGCVASAEVRGAAAGERVRFVALVAASRRHRRPRGGSVLFVTFEDEEGLVEALIPALHYAALEPRLTTPGPYLVEGTTARDGDYRYVSAHALAPFHLRDHAWQRDDSTDRTTLAARTE
jgi:DNA polymerase III alpha subunit